jgi:tetratricopeptide (TPR) repeat protein
MPVIISLPRQRTIRFNVAQDDGNATALVEKAAQRAMEDVAPYRTALRQYELGRRGNAEGFDHAQAIAERAIGKTWEPTLAEERVTLRNLLALVALQKGDTAAAEAQFRLAELVPQRPIWVPALIAANRSFLAVAAKRPAEARAQLDIVDSYSYGIGHWPTILARVQTLRGLVAWSAGDIAGAEQCFTNAIKELATDPEPHIYLAQLFAAQGQAAKAQQEQDAASAVGPYDSPLSGLVLSSYWADPVHGGLTPRRIESP